MNGEPFVAVRTRVLEMAEQVAERVEENDGADVDEPAIEALLRESAVLADADVDADFVFAFAFLAGLVEPREFFERAYRLIGLFVGDDDDDDDDAADAKQAAAADGDVDDVRARMLTLRDELLQARLEADVPNVDGLVESGEMTSQFMAAVQAAFARFDADHDDVLNEAEFRAYFAAVNPDRPQVDDAVHAYVVSNFEVTKTGLTRLGFVQLYFAQAMEDREEVLKDFRNLGISLLQ